MLGVSGEPLDGVSVADADGEPEAQAALGLLFMPIFRPVDGEDFGPEVEVDAAVGGDALGGALIYIDENGFKLNLYGGDKRGKNFP